MSFPLTRAGLETLLDLGADIQATGSSRWGIYLGPSTVVIDANAVARAYAHDMGIPVTDEGIVFILRSEADIERALVQWRQLQDRLVAHLATREATK